MQCEFTSFSITQSKFRPDIVHKVCLNFLLKGASS